MLDEAATIDPVRRAAARVRLAMLDPIWFYPWVVVGLVAFAGSLVQGPSGFSYALNEDARSLVWSWLPVSESDEIIAEFLMVQSGLRLVFALPSLFFVYLLSVILLWVGSRVQLAFIHIAATNDIGFMRALHATALPGRSLFVFRLAFATLAFIALTFAILASSVIVDEGAQGDSVVASLVRPVAAAGGAIALVLNIILRNLVAPVMWRYEMGCPAAVGRVWRAVVKKPIPVLVFIGVKAVWVLVIWTARILTSCITCGIGLLPIAHHTFCAPLYLFDRLYSLYVLEHVMGIEFVREIESRGDGKRVEVVATTTA